MEKRGKIVAIIPAYNEESRIKETITNLRKVSLIDDIIVVDDGSTDNTSEKAKELNVKLIRLENNRGKGYAIGAAAKTIEYEYLVLVDGDLGKTSNEVEKLIIPVLRDEADVTIARFKKAKKKGGFGLVKNLAKYGVYSFTKTKLDSTLSGQRVYKKEVMDKIKYIPDRFGIEVAMTTETLRHGFRIMEVDVNMTHRETGRDISGFIHRGKQFFDISKTFAVLLFRR